jgi:hypothetical protein
MYQTFLSIYSVLLVTSKQRDEFGSDAGFSNTARIGSVMTVPHSIFQLSL